MNDLKNKVFHPIYFLTGEEAFFIDSITDYISENVLDANEKEFNQTVLYGLETNAKTIIENAKRFPMMSNHQVVIVKEAQLLKDYEELVQYIQAPLKSTILVICYKYKQLDKRKTFTKTVDKNGILFLSEKLKDWNIPKWTNEYVKSQGYTITQSANALLAEHLGSDLAKIANEIDKLKLNIPLKTEINENHIEDFIGISKDYNIFELQKALASKNILKANKIINYFNANQKEHPFIVVISILYSYFTKILCYHSIKAKIKAPNELASALKTTPYGLKDIEIASKSFSMSKTQKIISYLREYDLRSKGVDNSSVDHTELLRELIYKILH